MASAGPDDPRSAPSSRCAWKGAKAAGSSAELPAASLMAEPGESPGRSAAGLQIVERSDYHLTKNPIGNRRTARQRTGHGPPEIPREHRVRAVARPDKTTLCAPL